MGLSRNYLVYENNEYINVPVKGCKNIDRSTVLMEKFHV
jgi:hypothetical protein